ncbi:MAG TPA: NADP-dependent phosphogluconate dehydrogenase [Bryobacteraceae bacterium]|nr:NADP-dependent phosphogluconate dehydrogenase [Bryobacteraceae bacterium]
MTQYKIGVVGLGVMGQNLALNIADHGFPTAGFDLDTAKSQAAAAKFAGREMKTATSLADLAASLEVPRRFLIMVPAGRPVDAVIADLKPHLSAGDILIDGGNSFFPDTDRRGKDLEAIGVRYIGMGVSGGEEGARHGPALMPGGQEEAYRLVERILDAMAAKVDGQPCSGYIGKGGAGHYVKMVHNGIEYAIMQLICEAYDLMQRGLGMTTGEMQQAFAEWNAGDMNSYLLEITAAVLGKTDAETGRPMVDVILDRAGQKGTGKWTSQNAMDLGIAIPTIDAALEARILSAVKDERVAASQTLGGPDLKIEGDRQEMLEILRDALKLATFAAYAQGFSLLREASKEYGYDLHYDEIAKIWRGGCIIRARILNDMRAAFARQPDMVNLMTAGEFAPMVNDLSPSLRAAAGLALELGIPAPGLCSAMAYIDSYRTARLPQNLLQAQRDCFGAHGYERVDKPRGKQFHTEWM